MYEGGKVFRYLFYFVNTFCCSSLCEVENWYVDHGSVGFCSWGIQFVVVTVFPFWHFWIEWKGGWMGHQTYISVSVQSCEVLAAIWAMKVTLFLLRCIMVQTKYLISSLCSSKYSGMTCKVEILPQERAKEYQVILTALGFCIPVSDVRVLFLLLLVFYFSFCPLSH